MSNTLVVEDRYVSSKEISPSKKPSQRSEELSRLYTEEFAKQYGEVWKKKGYQRINLSIVEVEDGLILEKIYFVKENCEVIVHDDWYKIGESRHKTKINLINKVSAMLPYPIADAFRGVKSEFQDLSMPEVKAITAFTFLGSAFSSVFGVNFIVLFIIMFGLAFFDAILVNFFKAAREPGTKRKEHQPLNRLSVFALLMVLFCAMSFLQVAIDYLVWKNQGMTLREMLADLPSWVEKIGWMVSAQNLSVVAIIGYYANRFRKVLFRATGFNLTPSRKKVDE
ncbi:hypothetical protein [Brevibacillus borstelensis]|uniref:hypothetical protein n=1 Tax=Brevibacillus borstelensis TaxID=45462 RepID=UPI0004F2B855|nr:hypothetical protein [Brevibacillus borstelensis]KKX54198.1 hypothetical protein X546_17770 [Brevibacillus borstelensis cifa_chp40]